MATTSLPAPDTTTLPGAPLELVIFQVRFDEQPSLSPNAALKAKKMLGDHYDALEPASLSEVSIQITPDGAQPVESKSTGWRFVSRDKRWTVSIFRDQASIECTGYVDWDGFQGRILGLLDAVASLFSPQLVQRLGLRYVDRIMRPESRVPADWDGLLSPATLGFVSDSSLTSAVEAVRTEQLLRLSDCQAMVRTSCASDNKGPSWHSMVVDTDCFEDRAFAYDHEELGGKIEILHDAALQLFQVITTKSLRDEWLS